MSDGSLAENQRRMHPRSSTLELQDSILLKALDSLSTYTKITVMSVDQKKETGSTACIPDGRIVLFDAECVLCSANASFILSHDRHNEFYLASMQGEVGAQLFRQHGLDPKDPTTILVIEGAKVRRDSDAVLSIYEGLGFPWFFVRIFRVIPRFLRDPIYRFVARNRYRIFGKRESCWVPPEHQRSRVLS